MNRIPTSIEEILTHLFAGEVSEREAELLREWRDASAENKKLLAAYRKADFALTDYCRRDKYDEDKAWNVLSHMLRRKDSLRLRHVMKYAAIIILAFGAGIATVYFHPSAEKSENDVFFTEYTVPYGSKSTIVLPDSSSIWLNAGSRLRYGSDFNRTNRTVFVEGEAYFKVARNEAKPFFVKTPAITLKVLGTSFNVKAYPEEHRVETIVESGSVQVLRNVKGALSDNLILTAGQKVTVFESSLPTDSLSLATPFPAPENVLPDRVAERTVVAKNVKTELYTSWKDTRWLIMRETLESLAVKLERRYNVRITFTDEALKDFSFSGTLEDETLEQVLKAIRLSAPIHYTIHQNTVTLSRNKWITTRN
ncbi:MAG: FecR domain-containing protein [Tannerella sp.]|jgi:ferric-dicitrate binding protein FerR (iron transport regulator)|nr:FecR domain-containing protein [Tannerella sp.]